MLNDNHRRVNPARESTGSDLYTVLRYNAIAQVADLAPAGTNQRGILRSVPVCVGFGGAWEIQSNHQPSVPQVDASLWGNCPRGPRWGTNYPIQPGDMVRVEYQGEMMSDPVVTGFFRWRDGLGIPWVANQVLGGRANDYSRQCPQDDASTENRYDLLLPTGAWQRSGDRGSWTLATSPVHFPMAWMSLGADGKIKIKARSQDDTEYTAHLEFDPTAKEARIAVGALNDASHIEFKDGDINVRTKGKFQVFSERMDVDLAPQSGSVQAALSGLQRLQSGVGDRDLVGIAIGAAGSLVAGGHDPVSAAAEIFNNPIIEEGTRNRIQDLVLSGSPVAQALNGFVEGMGQGAIADQLLNLVGAESLSGALGNITQRFDLGAITEQLGIPSWVVPAVTGELSEFPTGSVLDLAGLSGRGALTELCRHCGAMILDGRSPEGALQDILSEIEGTGLVDELFRLPGTPFASADDGNIGAIAARLGSQVLQGNDVQRGAAQLFDGLDFEELLGGDLGGQVRRMAGVLERQFTQLPIPGMDLIGQLPDLDSLLNIPREIRSLIPSLGPDLIGQLPDIASGLVEGLGDPVGRMIQQLERLPQEILGQIQNLPQELLGGLSELPIESLQGLMADPQAAIDSLVSGLGGLGDRLQSGILTVESIRDTLLARPLPDLPRSLGQWEAAARDLITEASPIIRYAEYGRLNLPDRFKQAADELLGGLIDG